MLKYQVNSTFISKDRYIHVLIIKYKKTYHILVTVRNSNSKSPLLFTDQVDIEHIKEEDKDESTSKEHDSNRIKEEKLHKELDHQSSGNEFVPFQYYATTGEKDEETSQLLCESNNSTWDQKMDEV